MGDQWQPLGIRHGWWEDGAPYEEIPDHLVGPLSRWIRNHLGGESKESWDRDKRDRCLEVLMSRLRFVSGSNPITTILGKIPTEPNRVFEAIDMSLWLTKGVGAGELDLVLVVGGSVWSLTEARDGLERRVEPSQREAFRAAATPQDIASEHLREAWANAYGIHPDPSDSWDHSIKAVEALLWGEVIPKNNLATFGSILDALEAKPSKWVMRLNSAGGDVPVETFAKMLRLMWVNPDRHATGAHRPVTQQEAEDVVQLAVLVVAWVRSGSFAKAP